MDEHVHAVAVAIYNATACCPLAPPPGGAVDIATRLGLRIYTQPHAQAEATLARWGGLERIVVRRGLQVERVNFLVAQMAARFWLREHSDGTVPDAKVAAWLVAPPGPFAARYHQVGVDLAELARPFAVTRTAALLRLHEVVGLDVAVVGERVIHRRGKRFGWLDDAALRQLAKKRRTTTVRKVTLRNDGGAVGLLAAS